MQQAKLPHPILAALFDFDETMIDLEAQHDAAHHALCDAMSSDYAALPDSFRLGSGRRIVDDIAQMRDFFGWKQDPEVLYAIRHERFIEELRRSDLQLMPGVAQTVRVLHARHLRLAITTSADADGVRELLERFELAPFFEIIVGGSEVLEGKPAPEAYLLTAAKLGVPPGRCVVFEDSEVGVLAAKRAGMSCIAVRNPDARQRQDLSAADVELQSFEEFDPEWLA